MSNLKVAVVTTLVAVTLSTSAVAGKTCRPIKQAVSQKEQKLQTITADIRDLKAKRRNISRQLDTLEGELRSAQNGVSNARNSLRALRSDYHNADEIIRKNRRAKKAAEAELPGMVEEQKRLHRKYKSIKVNLFNAFKRVKALAKLNSQKNKVEKKRRQIENHQAEIRRIKHLRNNFDELEDQRMDQLERAERRLFRAEDSENEIDRLTDRKRRLTTKIRNLETKKVKVESNLSKKRTQLANCRAKK